MIRALVVLAGVTFAASAVPPQRLGRFALVLEDAPLARRIKSRAELHSPAMQAAGQAILAKQAEVRAELERRGFTVTGADHILVNAVFIVGTPEASERLAGIKGVRRSMYLPPARRMLSTALDLIRAPQAWTQLNGAQNAGAGIKIAIIDTGIDQTHPAFQEPCLNPPSGPYCDSPSGECAFTNGKVIAARSYVRFMAAGSLEGSHPDDLSPRDRHGHGTAIAMIAAGNQVSSPAGAISGVAPKACLGNYKVFGSPGLNDFAPDDAVFEALRDAFLDGMDIASLSLGRPAVWGPLDTGASAQCGAGANEFCDARIEAIESAMAPDNGMVVVVAAGNSGERGTAYPALNTIETPATAPSAITVGASTNQHEWHPTVRVPGDDAPSNLRQMPARSGDGPQPLAPLTLPARDVATVGDETACSPLPAGSLNGAVALVLRRPCTFTDKVNNAQAAGARAVILYMNEGEEDEDFFTPIGLFGTGIPFYVIRHSDGVALKQFLAAHPNHAVTLDPTLQSGPATADRINVMSSRGPSIAVFGVKPEVVAVGENVFTATQNYDLNSDFYSPSRYAAASGTSFAAPMVTGVAALVKQKNPSFTPAQVKSAVVNTAVPITGGSTQLGILEMGAGKVNAENAVRTDVTAVPSTISFGDLTNETLPKQVTLTLSRAGMSAEVQPAVPDSNTTLTAAVTGTTLTVRLAGQRPAPGLYHGVIVLNGGSVPLRVPYIYFVSDGQPHQLISLYEGFDYGVDEVVYGCSVFRVSVAPLVLKLVDRFGVPLNTPEGTLDWEPLSPGSQLYCTGTGGSRVCSVDGRMDRNGIGGACVVTSPEPGEQAFRATLRHQGQTLTTELYGWARLWPGINTNGVVDAATNAVDPARGLVAGSLVAIYGTGLGDAVLAAQATPNQPLSLPIALGSVSVSFDAPSAGLSIPGRLLYASPNQVNVQIPWEFEGLNQVFMKVWATQEILTWPYTVKLATAAPQLYQYPPNSDMAGFAVAQFANTDRLVNQANPARRGDWITLWGNAFGPVSSNRPPTGEVTGGPLAPTRTTPVITIGGRQAEINYAGLHPHYVGLYQINVRIPADALTGTQPIIVNMNGVMSQAANIVIQ